MFATYKTFNSNEAKFEIGILDNVIFHSRELFLIINIFHVKRFKGHTKKKVMYYNENLTENFYFRRRNNSSCGFYWNIWDRLKVGEKVYIYRPFTTRA